MNNLIKQIKTLNEIYNTMNRQYAILKKMFKNHSNIKQKIILSEQILHQAYSSIVEKTETVETNREFNRIIKGIKDEKN
jgi:glyceraldehyde-3-phosphate dehydrogenase/erythrose-4-phosphate dehydrogenase